MFSILELPKDIRIFNFRFVDKIKNIGTAIVFEKSRLVVQDYNDHGKTAILAQSSTIQQMSQQIILALSASSPQLGLYLNAITQAYVQPSSFCGNFISNHPLNSTYKTAQLRRLSNPYMMSLTEVSNYSTYIILIILTRFL